MKIIVGLGNPGKEYETTRHNIGFMTIDKLAEKYGIDIRDCSLKGLLGKGVIGNEKCILVKPMTYMNLSGECLRAVKDYYKVDNSDIIVVHDDIDLDPGQLRIRKQGAAGTHNGMKSVIANIGPEAFIRVRVGVGDKPEGWDLADYVMSHLNKEADAIVYDAIANASDAIEMIVDGKMNDAMTKYNKSVTDKNQ